MLSPHSGRLERWLGSDTIERIQHDMNGWYGPPIHILDVPGSVKVTKDGDFLGPFEHGYFASAKDIAESRLKKFWNTPWTAATQYNAGFASLSDALSKLSGGKKQTLNYGPFHAISTTSTTAGQSMSLWYVGPVPGPGANAASAPEGTAHTSSDDGALKFINPTGGETTHLIGADIYSSATGQSLLLYDRLYAVNKTMNSVATESVTGVPTRYQSTTAGDPDYIGGNFLFIECKTVLPETAHNWTTCLYTDQDGNGSTLPSVTGISSCAINKMDMSAGWFAPLETGDVGIKALTQMQCSASLASGAITFAIGHPIGFMTMPFANMVFPFDWLTNRDLAPRIFDDACLALIQPTTITTSATSFNGQIYIGQG